MSSTANGHIVTGDAFGVEAIRTDQGGHDGVGLGLACHLQGTVEIEAGDLGLGLDNCPLSLGEGGPYGIDDA